MDCRETKVPCVDVVIAVLNGMPYLREAVSSALEQADVHTHVFVVDGGSVDGTLEAAYSWRGDRVTLIAERGRVGTCEARNMGVRMGTSPWISFLDADDIWPTGRTRRLLSAIRSPDQQIATGNMLMFSGDIDPRGHVSGDGDGGEPAVCIGSTVFSRAVYDRVGDFNEELEVAEFVEWMARARTLGLDEVRVPTVALLRRHHGGNTSVRRRDSYSIDLPRLAREHLARVRAATSTQP